MADSFNSLTQDISRALGAMRKEIPDTMQGFSSLAKSALAPGALSELQKELIALAIGVSSRCDACIGFHVKALIKLGMTRAQLMETLAVCTYMGGGPALMYAAEAVRAYEEFTSILNTQSGRYATSPKAPALTTHFLSRLHIYSMCLNLA